MRSSGLSAFALALVISACSGAAPPPSPDSPDDPGTRGETTSGGADTVASSPAQHDPNARPDVGDAPRDCPFRVDQACYATEDEACTAISCPRDQCQILESYPAQVRCQTSTP